MILGAIFTAIMVVIAIIAKPWKEGE